MRTIAIMNNKGGCGKTVTAVNLGDILSRVHGKNVLLVDCDGQMNLSRLCIPGFDPDTFLTLADVLGGSSEPYWRENVTPVSPGLDILPASSDLYDLDAAILSARLRPGCGLAGFIDAAEADGVDFVLLDCPPGYTAASVAALSAADEVIVPVSVDGFSVWGQREISRQLQSLRDTGGRPRRVTLLVTQWRNSEVVNQVSAMLRTLDTPVFRTAIRRTEKVPESTFVGLPVGRYSPRSAAAVDYGALALEILE